MSHAPLAALRVPAKLLALGLLLLAITPVQAVLLRFSRGPASMRLPPLFHRGMCAVLGLRIETCGVPVAAARTVFVSNHLSYLDVPALGGIVRACFVAKDDVRDWPVIGRLAGLQQTVFIGRHTRHAHAAADALSATLDAGLPVILFPEGTTSDGSTVLPFKSSLFARLADPTGEAVLLQPVSLELLAVDGRAIGDTRQRDLYAYHGDMRLLPHLLAFMRLSGARLRIRFHPPLDPRREESRKQLAARAHRAVVQAATASRA